MSSITPFFDKVGGINKVREAHNIEVQEGEIFIGSMVPEFGLANGEKAPIKSLSDYELKELTTLIKSRAESNRNKSLGCFGLMVGAALVGSLLSVYLFPGSTSAQEACALIGASGALIALFPTCYYLGGMLQENRKWALLDAESKKRVLQNKVR